MSTTVYSLLVRNPFAVQHLDMSRCCTTNPLVKQKSTAIRVMEYGLRTCCTAMHRLNCRHDVTMTSNDPFMKVVSTLIAYRAWLWQCNGKIERHDTLPPPPAFNPYITGEGGVNLLTGRDKITHRANFFCFRFLNSMELTGRNALAILY